jgi:hypothetical protein
MIFLTVPTAGSHPQLLNDLIADCGLPLENIIVVATRESVPLPKGVIVITDLGPPNIQRWWNRGIEEARARGASVVAVVNDDLRINAETLPKLTEALSTTKATIASPSRPPSKNKKYKRPLTPYSPRIWGCLWVLDATSTLRANENYVWWYGDNDLDIRARRDYGGVVNVDVYYEHLHSGEGTAKSSVLQGQSDIDAITFQKDYARLITLTSAENKILKLLKSHKKKIK